MRASNGSETLLKVIKSPVSAHLPPGFHGYGFSCTAELQSPAAFAAALPRDAPLVFVLGAMAQGHVTVDEHPYMEKMISISSTASCSSAGTPVVSAIRVLVSVSTLDAMAGRGSENFESVWTCRSRLELH